MTPPTPTPPYEGSTADVTVEPATGDDAARVAELFDAYRVCYGQDPAPDAALAYINERMASRDSQIFVARVGGQVEGFAQLYPSFSSIAMGRIWILNDIYVTEDSRKHGIASRLLQAVERFAAETGAGRLEVSTARDNLPARALYEKMGWQLDEFFLHYYRALV